MSMMKKKNQSGFTLIEILVVVAIVGMIGMIITTRLTQSRVKARDSKRRGDLLQMQKALENYYTTNNGYPTTGGLWRALPTAGGNCTVAGITTSGATGYIPNLAPGFVGVLPTDPRPGQGLCAGYNYRSDGLNYKIISNSVGGTGGPETFPALGQPFYDPARPTTAIMVTNSFSQTSASCPSATCW
jgi:prepilin-type N-terminal cleavage/methylation domain-containing protein